MTEPGRAGASERPGPRVVVAGYGNPLRGDDGAGWQVAEALAERWGARVTVLVNQHPLPEWAPVCAEADVAYFVDAAPASGPDESVVVRPLAARAGSGSAAEPLLDGHALGPEALLQMAGLLYGHAPEAYLVCIPASEFGFSEQLSPRTATATQQAITLLDRLLRERLGEEQPGARG